MTKGAPQKRRKIDNEDGSKDSKLLQPRSQLSSTLPEEVQQVSLPTHARPGTSQHHKEQSGAGQFLSHEPGCPNSKQSFPDQASLDAQTEETLRSVQMRLPLCRLQLRLRQQKRMEAPR